MEYNGWHIYNHNTNITIHHINTNIDADIIVIPYNDNKLVMTQSTLYLPTNKFITLTKEPYNIDYKGISDTTIWKLQLALGYLNSKHIEIQYSSSAEVAPTDKINTILSANIEGDMIKHRFWDIYNTINLFNSIKKINVIGGNNFAIQILESMNIVISTQAEESVYIDNLDFIFDVGFKLNPDIKYCVKIFPQQFMQFQQLNPLQQIDFIHKIGGIK